MDLDGLQGINDRKGHEAGDAAIATAAALLRGVCRSSDVLARLGGDEFVIVGEGTELAAASLRECISVAAAQSSDQRPSFSLSTGVAYRPAHSRTSASELLAAADQAMYEAKRKRKTSGPKGS